MIGIGCWMAVSHASFCWSMRTSDLEILSQQCGSAIAVALRSPRSRGKRRSDCHARADSSQRWPEEKHFLERVCDSSARQLWCIDVVGWRRSCCSRPCRRARRKGNGMPGLQKRAFDLTYCLERAARHDATRRARKSSPEVYPWFTWRSRPSGDTVTDNLSSIKHRVPREGHHKTVNCDCRIIATNAVLVAFGTAT